MRVGRVYNYPWWQDLAGVSVFGYLIISAILLWDRLPGVLASHFDLAGHPNGYTSKGFTLLLLVGVHLLCWGIDIFARYQCLLAEVRGKRYNWFQLLMAPFLLLNGYCWWFIVQKNTDGSTQNGLAVLAACTLANWSYLAATEKLREAGISSPGPALAGSEISGTLPERFCLVTREAPRWWVLLTGISGALILANGFYILLYHQDMWWAGVVLILSGLLTAGFAGGFRFVVHPGGVEVSLGLGIPLKSIPIEQITGAEVCEFSPLQDFGGWGIRLGKNKTLAFLVSGSVGLLVRTESRNFLLGTDRAATLLEAVRQSMEKASPRSA